MSFLRTQFRRFVDHPKSKGIAFIFAIFALFFVVGVIKLVVAAAAADAWNWRRTSGTIVNKEIDSFLHPHKRNTSVLRVTIQYDYQVNGNSYRTNQVYPPPQSAVVFHAADLFSAVRYRVGEEVAVYYDPDHPRQAVLNRGRWGMLAFLILGLFLFGSLPACVYGRMIAQKRNGKTAKRKSDDLEKGKIREPK